MRTLAVAVFAMAIPAEQRTLFTDVVTRRLTVRDAEQLARRVAVDRVRKDDLTPELLNLEREFTEKLGTRVRIERKDQGGGGRVLIEFFSADDLVAIKQVLAREREAIASAAPAPAVTEAEVAAVADAVEAAPVAPKEEESDDLYSISNFTV